MVVFHHGRGDIRSGDNVLLVLDSSLDNQSMVDIRDQTGIFQVNVRSFTHVFFFFFPLPDGNIMFSNQLFDSLLVGNITRDSSGTRELLRQSLSILKSSTS